MGKAEIAMHHLVADWLVVANIPKKWMSNVISSEGVSGLKAFTLRQLLMEDELTSLACNLNWLSEFEEPYESRGSRTVLREVRGWNSPLPTQPSLIMCHVTAELSPDDSYANVLVILILNYAF